MKKTVKSNKVILIVLLVIVVFFVLVLGIPFIVLGARSSYINTDIEDIMSSAEYSSPVNIDGIPLVTQDISCGYAVMEMISNYIGESVTEESLFDTYGSVVTSTGKSFEREMNIWFTDYQTTMHRYLTNDELIAKVYHSLEEGMPVPFEWAAKKDDVWTLHYSLVVGLDVRGDNVRVLNPYGYVEQLSIEDFLMRTSYEAYSPRPLFIDLAFAFGVFEKNTIFIMTQRP